MYITTVVVSGIAKSTVYEADMSVISDSLPLQTLLDHVKEIPQSFATRLLTGQLLKLQALHGQSATISQVPDGPGIIRNIDRTCGTSFAMQSEIVNLKQAVSKLAQTIERNKHSAALQDRAQAAAKSAALQDRAQAAASAALQDRAQAAAKSAALQDRAQAAAKSAALQDRAQAAS